MKRQIRRGVFETNSSSCHSITFCSEDEFEQWKNGKLAYDMESEDFTDSYKMCEADKREAEKDYSYKQTDFQKDWEDLSDETKEEWYKKYIKEHHLVDRYKVSYSDFFSKGCCQDAYCDTYVRKYTSKSGDKIVAFGCYGHD